MNAYTELARQTVENYAKTGQTIPIPADLPPEFYSEKKGVFVTIFKAEGGQKNLRGCVGTLAPTRENIAEEISQNAVWASQDDNRFPPINETELDKLAYEVSLLEPPERIRGAEDLDPERYGVIVEAQDGRTGLLLPAIEGVDSPLCQIGIAARKAGIDITREEYVLFRFTVTKFEE